MTLTSNTPLLGTAINPLVVHVAEQPHLFGTEFFAALIGAIVGGLIGIVGVWLTLRHTSRVRKEQQHERAIALGKATLFKALRIQSNFFHLHLHLEQEFKKGADLGMAEPWQFATPILTAIDPVYFTSDELVFVSTLKDDRLMQLIMQLDALHNSLLRTFDVFNDKYKDLEARLPTVSFTGNIGTIEMPAEQALQVRPLMITINDLIEQSRPIAEKNFEEAGEAVKLLESKLTEVYGLKLQSTIREDLLGKLSKLSTRTTPNVETTSAPAAKATDAS